MIPDIIKKVGFPFDWEEREVWTLDVPIEEIDIAALLWHFEVPFWETDGGVYDLCPAAVIKDPAKYPQHSQRIERADIAYPLDILKNPKTGYWTLLDGLHRLVRLYQLGHSSVRVRKISMEAIKTTPSYRGN